MAGDILITHDGDHKFIAPQASFGVVRGGGLFVDNVKPIGSLVRKNLNYFVRNSSKIVRWIGGNGTSQEPILFVNVDDQGIWSSSDNGNTWTQDVVYTASMSGFHYVTGSDNKPYICVADWNTGVRSYDGISWRYDTLSLTFREFYCHAYQGLFLGIDIGSGTTFSFDPVTRALSNLGTMPNNSTQSHYRPYFTLGKRLFVFVPRAPNLSLNEFIFGDWITLDVGFITYIDLAQVIDNDHREGAAIKLADDSVLIFGSGNAGLGDGDRLECAHVKLVAGVPTQTRVTETVVPSTFRTSAFGDRNGYRCRGFIDNSDPDNPRRLLYFSALSEQRFRWSIFEVFDEATEMSYLGTTNYDNEWTPPSSPVGGGQYYEAPQALAIQFVNQVKDPEGLRIYFKCSGDPGVPDKTVSFRYVNNLGVPNGICTLVPGTEGGSSDVTVSATGLTVENIDANEAITYEVVWDFLADGVPDGTYLHNQAFIVRA